MKAPQRIESQKVLEIASLLIPLQGYQVLLPNVSVAEIIPIAQSNPVNNAPLWYLGNIIWREQNIPLVSFEAMNDEAKSGLHNRARFAVLNTTGISNDLPFMAIVAQGLPRLARVSEEEISTQESEDLKAFVMMHVSWAGEDAIIPALGKMEQAILDYRQQAKQDE